MPEKLNGQNEMYSENTNEPLKCPHCGTKTSTSARYCAHCGKNVSVGVVSTAIDISRIRDLILIFVAIALIITLPGLFYDGSMFGPYIQVFTVIFFLLAMSLMILYRRDMFPLLLFRGNTRRFLTYFAIQLGITSLILIISYFLHINGFENVESDFDATSPHTFWLVVVLIAVFPPLTEEVLFRGILFNQVQKLSSARTAIVTTAILFGFVHLSIFSYLWLVPYGFFLAWIRHREQQIWYGIFFHFFHNFTVTLFDLMS